MDFKEYTLKNGLTVAGEVNKSAQTAAVGFFVRTGARDENNSINGVSHFLEHMMFKGTDKLSALEVNEAFDRTGAKFNAFTSEENTVYYAAVLPEMLADVTDLWCQLMRPSLRNDDFDMEKNVIKEEIAMYKDYPQFDVVDRCKELHFKDHPCGFSVLGTTETIDALAADQMREYFSRRYAADNITAACCGNFDFDALCGLIEEKCGSWEASGAKRELSFFDGSFEKGHKFKNSLKMEHICLMSPAVSYQDEQRFAMMLLAMIIGDSSGSRYYWSLVDSALADEASMHYDSMDGVGLLYSYIRCGKSDSEKVKKTLDEILAEVAEKGVSEDELEKARNKVLSTITIKCETPMGRLVNLGFNWTYLKKYFTIDQDVQDVKSVTVKQVSELAAKFRPNRYTMYCLSPE